MPLQVRKQKEAVYASYRKLQRAPVATTWSLTLDELVWAVNVATSRPFSIPSHWTESIAGDLSFPEPVSGRRFAFAPCVKIPTLFTYFGTAPCHD